MKVITTHLNADFDALASMIAAQRLYPDARLVFPGSQETNLRYLLKIPGYNIPYLKLKDINIEDIDHLILVDTRMADRIGDFAHILNKQGLVIHVYDHHPSHPNDINGEYEVIKEVGATTTIFVQIFQERGIQITSQEATIMALGIYEDTGCFTFSSTTAEDLGAAAYLLSQGTNLNMVTDMINRGLTLEQIELMNELFKSLETHMINEIPIHIATAVIDKYIADIAVLANKIKDIENLDCIFILVSMDDRIHLVARSRIKEVDVGHISRELGGGGHYTAASATIKDKTLIQAKHELLEVLQESVHLPITAQEIMTYPVKTIKENVNILEAKRIFNQCNINTIPVMGEKDELLGIITRRTIDKAVSHGMESSWVKECMMSDLLSVTPDTPIDMVRELIVESNQRFIPVMKKGLLVGVITKTDLIRGLHDDLSEMNPSFKDKEFVGTNYFYSKNLNHLLKERLPEPIQDILKITGEVAEELGFSAYIVGGFVRDIILRVENFDIDIVVEGNGVMLAEYLSHKLGGRMCSYQKFGTAVITLPDDFKIDVATARMEYYPKPVDLPNVEMSSIKHDLYRRDFTINTLAIQLNPSNFGRLIDFFGGQRDLKDKKIRVLHSLSFVEDPTRVFRAIRFEQRYGFEIGKYSKDLIVSTEKMGLLEKLDGHRLYIELFLILQEPDPTKAIKRMDEFNLLKYIHPSIHYDNLESMLIEVKNVLTWFRLLYLSEEVEEWFIYFLAIVNDVEKNTLKTILDNLTIAPKYQEKIMLCVESSKILVTGLAKLGSNSYSNIYKLLNPIPTECILFIMAKCDNSRIKKMISYFLTVLKKIKITISGNDLKEMGFMPGPIFRKIMEDVHSAKLDGYILNHNDELAFVRKQFKDSLKKGNP